MITRCKSCGREIEFIRTKKTGSSVPVTLAPVRGMPIEGKRTEGRPWARGYDRDGASVAVYLKAEDGGDWPAWMPCVVVRITHFVDCVDRDQFKRKKASE